MSKPKKNPYKQALLNGLTIWSPVQFVEALTKADLPKQGFPISKAIMTELMCLQPEGAQKPRLSGPDGRQLPSDTLEVESLGDLFGTCEVCGKLKAQIMVEDKESGRAVAVCGDCYPGQREDEAPVPAQSSEEKPGLAIVDAEGEEDDEV